MKIMIIGYSGSGKSTLARYLSSLYQIELLHLDQLFFRENWQPRANQDVQADLSVFLQHHHDWVIDGVYSRFLFQERLELADQIIFLDFPRWAAFGRICKRYLTYRGKTRPSAAHGCQERLDWPFVKFVLFTSRHPKRRVMYDSIEQQYGHKLIHIRSQKELDDYIQDLK